MMGSKHIDLHAAFEAYAPRVFRRAFSILNDEEEAKDLTQEVFIKLAKDPSLFSAKSQLFTWLYRVTTNACLNRIRDDRRRQELRQQHLVRDDDAGIQPASEERVIVQEVLARAPEPWARAAIYVYVDGMSHREAAQLLGVSRRTVGNYLEDFQRMAKEMLQQVELPTPSIGPAALA